MYSLSFHFYYYTFHQIFLFTSHSLSFAPFNALYTLYPFQKFTRSSKSLLKTTRHFKMILRETPPSGLPFVLKHGKERKGGARSRHYKYLSRERRHSKCKLGVWCRFSRRWPPLRATGLLLLAFIEFSESRAHTNEIFFSPARPIDRFERRCSSWWGHLQWSRSRNNFHSRIALSASLSFRSTRPESCGHRPRFVVDIVAHFVGLCTLSMSKVEFLVVGERCIFRILDRRLVWKYCRIFVEMFLQIIAFSKVLRNFHEYYGKFR